MNYLAANNLISFISSRTGVSVTGTFTKDDTAEFIQESLDWILSTVTLSPADLALVMAEREAQETVTMEEVMLPREIEKASINTVQKALARVSGCLTEETDKVVLWSRIVEEVTTLVNDGCGDRYNETRGWMAQQVEVETAIQYVLRRLV